jgi:hypothetical protein
MVIMFSILRRKHLWKLVAHSLFSESLFLFGFSGISGCFQNLIFLDLFVRSNCNLISISCKRAMSIWWLSTLIETSDLSIRLDHRISFYTSSIFFHFDLSLYKLETHIKSVQVGQCW